MDGDSAGKLQHLAQFLVRRALCQRAAGLDEGEAPLQGGGSDACTTGAAGVPSIDGLGPRGTGFHTLHERVELGTLVPKAEALARYLAGRWDFP